MDTPGHILWMLGAGALILLLVWLPLALKRLPLSFPIILIALGAAIFWMPWVSFVPMPLAWPRVTERLTEAVVIIALMGAGLKIDTEFGFRRWGITWRLLAITMPLSIAGILLLGLWAGLPLAAALLLGAALAPTDPVLASDVQVGPPRTGEEDEVRFGLTSEAGLNDGLAFPFVNLAIAFAALSAATAEADWLRDWVLKDVIWKLVVGIIAGWLVGRVLGLITFSVTARSHLARTGDGLLAIAATFLSYALAEVVQSYGFLAVFVTGLTLRNSHRTHEYHGALHGLIEQVERLAMALLLLLFGGALASGLLTPLVPGDVLVALAVLLIVRPAAGLIGLAFSRTPLRERLILSVFGIRGIGSFYYLAYALNHEAFPEADRLWAIVGLIVLLSILLHGLTVTPVMDWLDRTRDWMARGRKRGEPRPGPTIISANQLERKG